MRWAPLLAMLVCAPAMRVEQEFETELDNDLETESAMDSSFSSELEAAQTRLTVRVIDSCDTAKSSCVGGSVKPRRPTPTLLATDFSSRLQKNGGSWVLSGALNDWPAYKDLKLLSMHCDTKGEQVLWTSESSSEPRAAMDTRDSSCRGDHLRLKLELPAYLAKGWSPTSPGFVMLMHNLPGDQYLTVGTDLLNTKENCKATTASIFAHQYGDSDSSNPHVGVFVEWDEGCSFSTIYELAWQNGLGGYGGKSNWYDDKFAKKTWIMQTMENTVPGMIQPWNSKKSELRVYDVPFKNRQEFTEHFKKYSAGGGHSEAKPRFRAVDFPATVQGKTLHAPVSVSYRSRQDIFRALLNYIGATDAYDIKWRQCQSFAADLYWYLTDESTSTYTRIIRGFYTRHRDWFLYEPSS